MYRRRLRNLDIFIAGGTALLGGAAYVAKVPGPLQVVLGIALFFAPGYLWSAAILHHWLPGVERVLTSAGLTLILPIIGGFLFYALHIPLFRGDWVGMLVVLTLLGLVAVAVQRLRGAPEDQAPEPPRRGDGPDRGRPGRNQPERGWLSPLNLSAYGLAVLVGLGAVGFSVKNAEAEKEPANTVLTMSPVRGDGTKADLSVTNHEGAQESYELKLLSTVGKVTKTTTWKISLSDGQTWDKKIAYTAAQPSKSTPVMTADLYKLPDTTTIYRYVDNGESTK
jgi:Protein of unknown function (DUF1616)